MSDKDNHDKLTNEQVLALTVQMVLNEHVLIPLMSEMQVNMSNMRLQWECMKEPLTKIMEGKVAQCPTCGALAFNDAMCDDLAFICPSCAEMHYWRHHVKTNRYTLSKEKNNETI